MPGERADVVKILRGHGLSGTAAAETWSVARDLVRSTRRRAIEHAATLDADTGHAVGRTLSGSESRTDLTPHLVRFASGREYVQVHTHPKSSSFSDLDLLILVTQPAIRVMAAIGINGTWYISSRSCSFDATRGRAVVEGFVSALRRAEAEEVPTSLRSHLALERVAGLHGVRYDRVMGSDHE